MNELFLVSESTVALEVKHFKYITIFCDNFVALPESFVMLLGDQMYVKPLQLNLEA